ncbi:MAG: iron-sulfur cluster assembly protein, partial [Fibrobacter sp.]|nr:iron-sulfur cluster assembly protein [Fibrobacter sp.]
MKENEVQKWLFEVVHPAKDKNVVELGMVEKVEIVGDTVTVTLAFSRHRDPLAEYLIQAVKAAIIRNAPKGTAAEVKTVLRDEGKKPSTGLDLGNEELEHVGRVIAVASGKGGVGKSTVAV